MNFDFTQFDIVQGQQMIEEHVNILSGLRTALDHIHSFVYIKNRNLKYVYANRHTLDLFGCTAEEIGRASCRERVCLYV